MGLAERAKSLNIVSDRASRAAKRLMDVKDVRDGTVKARINDDPETAFTPNKGQEDNLLALAETLIAEARAELGKV